MNFFMKYAPIASKLFMENRQRLIAQIPDHCFAVIHSADVAWGCADSSTQFIQNSDLFYLTGIDQEDTILMICPSHPDVSKREVLFIRETSDLIKIWEGHKLTKEEAAEISEIQTVEWADQFEEHLRDRVARFQEVFLNHNEHPRAGASMDSTPDDRFRKRIQKLYPKHRYQRLAPQLYELRQEKSDEEIKVIQKACDITAEGFQRVAKFVKPGRIEYEVEAELLHEFIGHGSKGFAYLPIIAGGANACVLHYIENDKVLKDGDLVLMDVAAEYANYKSDLTRTIPVNGKFTDRQRAVYNAVHRIFDHCIQELIKPGMNIREEFAPAIARVIEDELIDLGLIDAGKVAEERAEDPPLEEEKRCYRKYFMHGVSHSLGIDVHDVTPNNPCFVEGMVVTVEPGIYIPEEGFAVRLENVIIVKASGNIDLMADIPIASGDIEALMAG